MMRIKPLYSWSGSNFYSAIRSQANHRLWALQWPPACHMWPSPPHPLPPISCPTLVECPKSMNHIFSALPEQKSIFLLLLTTKPIPVTGKSLDPTPSLWHQVQRRGGVSPSVILWKTSKAGTDRQQVSDCHSGHVTDTAQTLQHFSNGRHLGVMDFYHNLIPLFTDFSLNKILT